MNLNDLIRFRPLMEGADMGGGTALGADAPPPEETPSADTQQNAAPEGADQGDAPQEDNSNDDSQEQNTDQAAGEFNLEVPEGFEQFSADFEAFSGEAKDWLSANPNATAADAFKWAAERQANLAKEQGERAMTDFQKTVDDWGKAARSDAEIGGDKFDENVAIGMKAIEAFGSDELKGVLNESGLGNHPAVIRFAVKAGRALQDAPVLTTQNGKAKQNVANTIYGND